MNQMQAIGIVAALMVLTIMVGGLVRRRVPAVRSVRLAAAWVAIILAVTLIAMLGQRLMR